MRIIAGKARGRKLIPPATMETRPTLDRVKEAMFSTIQNHLLDAIVIDVFAGTGSLGLEAASRGAKEVYLVDKSAVTFPLLKENVDNLKFSDFCFPLNKDSYDVLRDLAKKGKVMDVIFIDPPYCKEMIPEAMKIIEENKMLNEDGSLNSRDFNPIYFMGDDKERIYRYFNSDTKKLGENMGCSAEDDSICG